MTERILIVGHGSIGQRHLRIVRESLPHANLAVLLRSGAKEVEGVTCFTSMDQALAFKPLAAIIANPAPFHIDSALALARNGCHLLVEKPISTATEQVHSLLQVVREQGIVLQVGYNLRFLPSLRDFRRQVQSGRVGRILSVRCEVGQHLETWRPGNDYRIGVSARRELGGGVLLELSHELDYLRWIFGEAEWVSAWIGQQGALDIDVEDTAHLLLGMAESTGGDVVPVGPVVSLALDFLRRDMTRRCIAIGEYGSLIWDALTGTVELRSDAKPSGQFLFEHKPPRDYTYREQWLSFLGSVDKKESPLIDGYAGLAVIDLVERARQSAEADGMRVQVNHRGLRERDYG